MRFRCTSADVFNSVFDELGRTIDAEKGLKSLTIGQIDDQNILQEWPLSQLVFKSPNLEYLKVGGLTFTIPENRTQLLQFAG